MFHVNKMFAIYSKSDRCIYELTLEQLKANRNIHRISNWICFLKHRPIAFLSFITMNKEVPELYLKASVFTVDISIYSFYMSKGNHVKTQSMNLLAISPLRYIDLKNESPLS